MLNIKQRQLNLKTYYKYYVGEIDGIEGKQTKLAYTNFQKENNLKIDGIYGENTNNKLISVIKNIQELLNNYGYNLSIDGIVGNHTINAIKDFQQKNNLSVDGIVGKQTYSKLEINWSNIKHFKKEEFTCKCGCGYNEIDIRLVKILDEIREHFGKPIIITSGCRCTSHNAKVGGVQGSWHTKGKASDFYVRDVSTANVLSYCRELVDKGIIRYTYTNRDTMSGVVHIDIGNK